MKSHLIFNNFLSGVSVGLLAVPQSLSYASIAGIPLQYGLFSDLQFLYPLLGTSDYLIVGPVAVMSILSKKTVDTLAPDAEYDTKVELTCALCLLVGLMQILMGLCGVGKYVGRLLPEIVVFSFTFSAAFIIASTQLQSILLPFESRKLSMVELFRTSMELFSSGKADVLTLLLSFSNFLILHFVRQSDLSLFGRRFGSALRNSGPLVVLLLGLVVNLSFERFEKVGKIPNGLPTVPRENSFRVFTLLSQNLQSLSQLFYLFFSVLVVSLLGFSEAWTIAKTCKTEDSLSQKQLLKDSRVLEERRELIALGSCNLMTFFVGGYCVTGSFSRSAVNKSAGATCSLSSLFCCVFVLFVLSFCAQLLSNLPKASISCIVIYAVSKLINFNKAFALLNSRNKDTFVFLSAAVCSFVFGIEVSLLVAILVNFCK